MNIVTIAFPELLRYTLCYESCAERGFHNITTPWSAQEALCYQDLFAEVKSFEAFKHLHVGMISEVKRKSLPTIAKVTGLPNAQSLQQFLVNHLDETGDRKKGQTTDYVKRQYIGNLGKIENGIVSVNAYEVIDHLTFPLSFRVYKPKERLTTEDSHHTKPEIAAAIVQELCELGFQFELVLADSAYGESGSSFVRTLHQLELPHGLSESLAWVSADIEWQSLWNSLHSRD